MGRRWARVIPNIAPRLGRSKGFTLLCMVSLSCMETRVSMCLTP